MHRFLSAKACVSLISPIQVLHLRLEYSADSAEQVPRTPKVSRGTKGNMVVCSLREKRLSLQNTTEWNNREHTLKEQIEFWCLKIAFYTAHCISLQVLHEPNYFFMFLKMVYNLWTIWMGQFFNRLSSYQHQKHRVCLDVFHTSKKKTRLMSNRLINYLWFHTTLLNVCQVHRGANWNEKCF